MNLKKELKDAKSQITNGISLKGGKEIQKFVLQFQSNEEFGECFKINEETGKEVKNATDDKKNFMPNWIFRMSLMDWRPIPISSRYLSFKGNYFSCNVVGHIENECRNQIRSYSYNVNYHFCNNFGYKASECRNILNINKKLSDLSMDIAILAMDMGTKLLNAR